MVIKVKVTQEMLDRAYMEATDDIFTKGNVKTQGAHRWHDRMIGKVAEMVISEFYGVRHIKERESYNYDFIINGVRTEVKAGYDNYKFKLIKFTMEPDIYMYVSLSGMEYSERDHNFKEGFASIIGYITPMDFMRYQRPLFKNGRNYMYVPIDRLHKVIPVIV